MKTETMSTWDGDELVELADAFEAAGWTVLRGDGAPDDGSETYAFSAGRTGEETLVFVEGSEKDKFFVGLCSGCPNIVFTWEAFVRVQISDGTIQLVCEECAAWNSSVTYGRGTPKK